MHYNRYYTIFWKPFRTELYNNNFENYCNSTADCVSTMLSEFLKVMSSLGSKKFVKIWIKQIQRLHVQQK